MLNAMYMHNSTSKNGFIFLLCGMGEGKLQNVREGKLQVYTGGKTP